MLSFFRSGILLFIVSVFCFSGSSTWATSFSTSSATDTTITLKSGWNTFSTPKVLDSITFQSGGVGLYFYALTATGWQMINPSTTTIRPLEGFMVNNLNTADTQVSLSYKTNLSPMELLFQKSLFAGWNIVGITNTSNPFGSIGSSITMGVDFTKNVDGGTNFSQKVNTSYYSSIGNANLTDMQYHESYGIFLPSASLYAGIQSQVGNDTDHGDITFVKSSAGNITTTLGSSNVFFFRGTLNSTLPVTMGELAVTLSGTNTQISAFVNDQLVIKLNGQVIGYINSLIGTQTIPISSLLSVNTPVNLTIEGNIKNDPLITGEYIFDVSLTKMKDSLNNQINIGTGISVIGDSISIIAPSLTIKAATIAAPSSVKIYSNASGIEIGRFALQAIGDEITVRDITLTNYAGLGVNDFTKLVSGTNIKLVNVADGTQVSATVTMSGTTAIKLTGMSIRVPKDTTSNLKVLVDTQGSLNDSFTGGINANLTLNIAIPSASSSSSSSITVGSYTTTKLYSVSVVPPTVTLVKKNANTFLMTITNVDADSDITLASVTAQVRPVSVANSNFTAYACIRNEGSADKCGTTATGGVVNTVQVVPGSGVMFTTTIDVAGNTFPVSISKNSSITREIAVDSNYAVPGDLQAEITALNYGPTETYSVVAN